MNKEIQTLLAIQLILQKDSIKTHAYKNNEIIEDKLFSILESLKSAIESGLDIMLPLDEEEINSYRNSDYYCGTNGKITFIEKMMDAQNHELGLINYLYDKITAEDLEKAHPKFMSNLYSVLSENNISMKKMFELGFDFKQGTFDEDMKASSGNIDFFECCLCYKPDFDFSFKYNDDFTLKEAIEEEIEHSKKNNHNIKLQENLLNFIEKAVVKQKLEKNSAGIINK